MSSVEAIAAVQKAYTAYLRELVSDDCEYGGARDRLIEFADVAFNHAPTLLAAIASKDAEIERLREAISNRCECRFDGDKQYEECHLHQCQRSVCENGDPTDVTLEQEVSRLEAENEELRDAAKKALWDFDEIINPMMRGLGTHEFTLTPADLRAALSGRPPSEEKQ